jgi:hypothetical protein
MRRHVIISGTGRTGTSFLVQLLTRLGLDTGFDPLRLELDPRADAGLESDILADDAPYVVKSPWLSLSLPRALDEGRVGIDHAFIPMRPFAEAAASRERVQRLAEAAGEAEAPGGVPGGLWLVRRPDAQSDMLRRQFSSLMECLARHDVPITLLWFPRLVQDGAYLFDKLQPVLAGVSAEAFQSAFSATARPELAHVFEADA